MKSHPLLYLLFFLMIWPIKAQEWTTTPITDFVSVQVPGELEIVDSQGEVVMYTEDSNGIYAIVPTDLIEVAKDPLQEKEIDELFEGVLYGALKRSGGELINREAFTREGIRGEDFQIFVDSIHPYYAQDRFIRVMYHDRFLLNLSYTPSNQAGNQVVRIRDRFFNSISFEAPHTYLNRASEESAEDKAYDIGYRLGFLFGRFMAFALPVLLVLTGIIILIVFLVRRKKKKKHEISKSIPPPYKKVVPNNSMKNCSNCGKENSAIAKYCSECGHSLISN